MSLLKKYVYVDLDKLFLQERHSFLLKGKPINLQTHIDKLSIEIQLLLIMGVIFIGWNGELLPHQSQKIVEKMHW